MPDAVVNYSIGPMGQMVPNLSDPFGLLLLGAQIATDDEINGDGNANGTAILTITVAVGKVLDVLKTQVINKVNPTTVYIVQSDTNGVGGTETLLKVLDFDNPESLADFPLRINNLMGATPLYLVIYAPQTRGGAATNNANTEYWGVNVLYKISP